MEVPKLSRRARELRPSATMKVADLAREMRARGRDILDLSVGEPDQDTPLRVREAGKRAIDEGRTRYTANQGIVELREAVCRRLDRDHGLQVRPEQVLVSSGAKASLFLATLSLWEEGDRVVVPAPCWVSYPEQIRLAGAEPVLVPTRESEGFLLRPEDLEAVEGATGLVLNSPCNPTGAVYPRDRLEALAEVCVRRNLSVVSDEIYEKLVYDGPFTSVGSLGEAMLHRTVLVNGVSKAYAMTGWRLGYAVGPVEVIRAMAGLQSHMTSHPSSISQWASLEALQGGDDEVRRMAETYRRRRDRVVRGLRELPGVSVARPGGAFYVFPNVSGLLGARTPEGGRIASPQDLAVYWLETAGVAVVPGEGFGSSEHVRLSYAASDATLVSALERLHEATARLRAGEGE